MQGILFFVVALFVLTHAQGRSEGKGNEGKGNEGKGNEGKGNEGKGNDDKGGCCFYSDKEYKKVVVCTSEAFNIPARANIQSFFCDAPFSAAIINDNEIQELVGCGDGLDASVLPIPATRIAVGPCSPERRCCLYTGVKKDGDEFCLNGPSATTEELSEPQKNGKFRVAECAANYRAVLIEKGGKRTEVGCGVTHDIADADNTVFTAITMSPCTSQAFGDSDFESEFASDFVDQARTEDDFAALDQADQQFDASFDNTFDAQYDAAAADQFVDQAFSDDSFAADQFVDQAFSDDSFAADQFAGDNNFAVDQAFSDDSFAADQFVDQAFSDDSFAADNAFASEDGFVDQAVGDQFDAQFDQQFDASFDEQFDGSFDQPL